MHANQSFVQLILCMEDVIYWALYITVSGAAVNTDRSQGVFECNALQYTTFFKDHVHLSTLPIRAHFDNNRYKNKKPIPSNNSFIAVEGFVLQIELNPDTGQVSFFHVAAENITFLGKGTNSTTPVATKRMFASQLH